MNRRNRVLARTGASALGLLTAGAFAVPAVADGAADLGIEAAGGTIAAGAPSKFVKINLTNNGSNLAKGVGLTLDISGLDQSKVRFNLNGATGENGPVCEQPENGKIYCRSQDNHLRGGIQIGWFFPLEPVAGAKGDAGHITATVTHDGTDPDLSNNVVDLAVKVGDRGPDMFAAADDAEKAVDVDDRGRLYFKRPLKPGDIGVLLFMIVNQGDTTATGMKITITLPEGTTFVDAENDCVYTEDNRSAVCTYNDLPLIPAGEDPNPNDYAGSKHPFYRRVKVDTDVLAPAVLSGGSVSVEGIVADSPGTAAVAANEVDPSDNSDGFAVIVS